MDYVNIPDKVWTDLLTEKIKPQFQSLALKVLLSRLIIEIKTTKTNDVTGKCVKELKEFLMKNSQLPSLQKDLQMIVSGYSYKTSVA
jgi:hypothetical protein